MTSMRTMTLDSYFDAQEANAPARTKPDWVDRRLYPFDSHYLQVPAGALHYVDEGSGAPIVFVHGTPTWSFLFRDLIAALRRDHRCIAVDNLGFGLSDKPGLDRFDQTPRAHAANLERLLDHLGVRDVTLVVHDFGGPIGLAFAARHPERVHRLVVMNSWAWSNEGDRAARTVAAFVGSAIGRFLYVWCNFAVRVMLPLAFSDRRALTSEVRRHYAMPFARLRDRVGPWALGRELVRSSGFYGEVWRSRGEWSGVPMLLAWFTEDPAFRERHLARWTEAFPRARVWRIAAGHFGPEEAPALLRQVIERFLADSSDAVGPRGQRPDAGEGAKAKDAISTAELAGGARA